MGQRNQNQLIDGKHPIFCLGFNHPFGGDSNYGMTIRHIPRFDQTAHMEVSEVMGVPPVIIHN